MKSNVFVLVHPAWHGAWVWQKVAPFLRQKGHVVSTPTLTGLGERRHLARPEIGLETHVTDIVGALKADGLHDVILVGHSSSGAVITGVADRVPEIGSRMSSIWMRSYLTTVKAYSTSWPPRDARRWRGW
jgi:pimeloyl-ACP methyl ester carboxylesterase